MPRVYGIVGLKIACRLFLVVHREEHALRRYVLIGTGNCHSSTARFYELGPFLQHSRSFAFCNAGEPIWSTSARRT